MNCTKCGKELTEEGKTICDECQEKLLQEIKAEEEASTEKVEEIVEEVTENKTEETEAEKNADSKPKKKKSVLKTLLVLVVLVVIIAAVLLLLIQLGLISFQKVGATVGNIRNYGYAAYQDDKIYYVAPNADSTKIGIYSADITGENVTEIFMNELDVMSLNAYGDYLYFVTITEYPDTPGKYDNKINRMKKDGTELQVINDNEFNDYGYDVYVVKDKVYYIGEDSNIYKMDLDGSNRELVSDNKTGYIAITEDYIVYNDYIDPNMTEDTATTYKTCIMNLDGTEKRDILGNVRLFTVNVYEDAIYYTNEYLEVYKVNIDGTNNTKILDAEVYNLNVSDGYIYYLGYYDIENGDDTICVYRANLDGSDNKVIKKLVTGTNFINVLNGNVLYLDTDLDGAYIKIMNSEGTEEKNLYTLNLKDLYSQIEGTSIEEEIIGDETSTEVTNDVDASTNPEAQTNTTP